MSYMTISSQENHYFSLCSYLHAHPTTLLLKILGGQCMGRPPTSNFLGDRPPVPPRSPPLVIRRFVLLFCVAAIVLICCFSLYIDYPSPKAKDPTTTFCCSLFSILMLTIHGCDGNDDDDDDDDSFLAVGIYDEDDNNDSDVDNTIKLFIK